MSPVTPAILNYNQGRATKIAADVTDETEKQLRAALSKGVAEGKSASSSGPSSRTSWAAPAPLRGHRKFCEVTRGVPNRARRPSPGGSRHRPLGYWDQHLNPKRAVDDTSSIEDISDD
jgi:hypothetical protein